MMQVLSSATRRTSFSGADRDSGSRGGLALIAVVLVLVALLMLCAPFLLTARNSDQASQQIFSRAEARSHPVATTVSLIEPRLLMPAKAARSRSVHRLPSHSARQPL